MNAQGKSRVARNTVKRGTFRNVGEFGYAGKEDETDSVAARSRRRSNSPDSHEGTCGQIQEFGRNKRDSEYDVDVTKGHQSLAAIALRPFLADPSFLNRPCKESWLACRSFV